MDYSKVETERINPRTHGLDTLKTRQILSLISKEDQSVASAVRFQITSIAKAADQAASVLSAGKTVFFVGAGTSGRLAVLEAAECPPTFHTAPFQIQAIIAGGAPAVVRSIEGAEDNAAKAVKEIHARVDKGDMVIGIAASGVTPFVLSALKTARSLGCPTALVTCNPSWRGQAGGFKPGIVIAIKSGAEVIAGSTRMKAGSATKMALNMITTAAMVKLGKVYGNQMVDLQIKSHKLQERALRITTALTGLNRMQALAQLKEARGQVKTAIVMFNKKLSYAQATKLLRSKNGFLRKALTK